MDEMKTDAGEQADAKAQISLDQSSADVSFANFVLVTTGAEEITLTFGLRLGDQQAVKVNDRIVLSPKNAKRFAAALGQSVKAYEERFGAIDISTTGPRDKGRQ